MAGLAGDAEGPASEEVVASAAFEAFVAELCEERASGARSPDPGDSLREGGLEPDDVSGWGFVDAPSSSPEDCSVSESSGAAFFQGTSIARSCAADLEGSGEARAYTKG